MAKLNKIFEKERERDGMRLFTRWCVCTTGAVFWFRLLSQTANSSLKRHTCQEGREECRDRRQEAGEEQEKKGKSQVTKTHHILDKPFHHITTLHHTENNALFLWEGGPYLHTPTTCSYLRRYKLELPPGTAQHQIREMGCRKVCKWIWKERGGVTGKCDLSFAPTPPNCSSLVSGKRGNKVGQITAHGEEITKKRGGCM